MNRQTALRTTQLEAASSTVTWGRWAFVKGVVLCSCGDHKLVRDTNYAFTLSRVDRDHRKNEESIERKEGKKESHKTSVVPGRDS